MNRKMGTDAFDYFKKLGPERTYKMVATHYKVGVRAVKKRAHNEGWQERLQDIERQAQVLADKKDAESWAARRTMNLKFAEVLKQTGLQALRSAPLKNPMDGARMIEKAIRLELSMLQKPAAPDDRLSPDEYAAKLRLAIAQMNLSVDVPREEYAEYVRLHGEGGDPLSEF